MLLDIHKEYFEGIYLMDIQMHICQFLLQIYFFVLKKNFKKSFHNHVEI